MIRFSCRIAFVLWVVGSTSVAGTDLKGKVTTESGKPIAGAEVFIMAATPRLGSSPLCPSCYVDCAKRTTTDADGKFEIRSLDPALLFQILFVAKGHKAKYVSKFDPAAGTLTTALAVLDATKIPQDCVVRGRVLGPHGSPVVGATIEPVRFDTVASRGNLPGVFDPVAVTDGTGEFILTSRSPVQKLTVKVEGRGLAPRIFTGLTSGREGDLRLSRGVQVSGRVVHDGKPVQGVMVGLSQVSRGVGTFLGARHAATDVNGRFLVPNVASQEDYYVYGAMVSLLQRGAIVSRKVRIGADGGQQELGDLTLQPAHRVAGRVVLSDDKAIPAGTRLTVLREQAWDYQSVPVSLEGKFQVEGVPSEEIRVSVRVQGYRPSRRNKSWDASNPFGITGYVDRDLDRLTILLEPIVE